MLSRIGGDLSVFVVLGLLFEAVKAYEACSIESDDTERESR